MKNLCIKFSIFIIFSLLSLEACKDNGVTPIPQPTYRFVFEIEYINYAWGYAHNGIYIDSTGTLHRYSYEGSSDIWHADSTGFYTREQLLSKYKHQDTVIMTINQDTVMKYFAMIDAAALGSYSDTSVVGADMGEFSYIAYKYNPVTKKYQQIVLREDGDWSFYNQSPSAMKIAAWLNSYRQDVF
jgi:hypothetical protein